MSKKKKNSEEKNLRWEYEARHPRACKRCRVRMRSSYHCTPSNQDAMVSNLSLSAELFFLRFHNKFREPNAGANREDRT